MVQIVAPTLPRRLFRYRNVDTEEKLNRELEAICQNYLWCSLFEALNDPMEGVFGISPTAARAPDSPNIFQEVLFAKQQMGICCFSDTHENDLMWVHYAGEYSGICVKYSTHDLDDGLKDVYAVRMQYDIQIPNLRAAETSDYQRAAIKALSSKKSNWYYEREWRLFAEKCGRLDIVGQNPVKAIYFGPRTKPAVIEAFRKGLSGVRGNTIKFLRPTSHDHRYQFNWQEITK